MSEFIWLFCLVITHFVAYFLGRNDGKKEQHPDEAYIAVEMYDIDKRYEHLRWLEERKDKKDE